MTRHMSTLVDELERVFATAFCPETGTFHPEAEAALDFLREYTRRPEVVERAGAAFERHFDPHNDGTIIEATEAALASLFPDA